MVKIPTFTTKEKPTTDVGSVTTGIQVSPRATVAASLLPGANELTNYAIKKRDNEEKLIAKKAVLELKAESDKIIESQKDNISEDEAINNWKTTITPLINDKLSTIKNRRVKKLVEAGIDLENSESIYHLKTNSFKAYEKESTKIFNDEMAIGVNNYKATDNAILKVKYKTDLKNKAEKFNKEHMLGSDDLKKRKEAIDSVLLLTDADSFIGLPNAEKQIANLDSSLKGETFLSNENFFFELISLSNQSKLGEKNFETFILLGFHPEYFSLNIFNFFDKDASNLYEIFFFKWRTLEDTFFFILFSFRE